MDDQKQSGSRELEEIFISYSRKDAVFAALLEKALENYVPPKELDTARSRLRVFRDQSDMTGVEYFEAIERHLKAASKLIVICSPNACGSKYVADEIRRFVKHHAASDVVAVLLSGIPNNDATAEQADQCAFPPSLVEVLPMPLAKVYLGFDPTKDKVTGGRFSGPWYELLASIFGASRDLIEQREQKRKARRLYIAGGAALSLIVVLSIALVLTLIARNDAERRRLIAESGELASRALARTERDEGLAMREAIKAVCTADTPTARTALRHVIQSAKARLVLQHGGEISVASYDGSGQRVFTAGTDGSIKIWDADSGDLLKKLQVDGPVRLLTTHPRAPVFAVAASRIYVFDAATFERRYDLGRTSAAIQSIAFDSDGRRLIGTSGAGTDFWDAGTGEQLGSFSGTVIRMAAFSRDGNDIVASYDDGHNAVVWNIATQSRTWSISHGGPVAEAYFDASGQYVAVRGASANAGVARLAPQQRWLREQVLHRGGVNDLEVSANGEFTTAGEDGTVRVWRLSKGEEPVWQDVLVGTEHGGAVRRSIFDSSGTRLASVGREGLIRIWRRMPDATWEPMTRLAVPYGDARSVAFSRDGSRLLAAGGDTLAVVLDVVEDHELHALRPEVGQITSVAFSPDGNRLLTSGSSQDAGLWDASTGRLISTLGTSSFAMFTTEGTVVTGTSDGLVRWSGDTGTRLETRSVGEQLTFVAALSADGRLALVREFTNEGHFEVWDVEDETRTSTIETGLASYSRAEFNRSGTAIVIVDGSVVHRFDTKTGREIDALDVSRLFRSEPIKRIDLRGEDRIVVFAEGGAAAVLDDFSLEGARYIHAEFVIERANFSANGAYFATVDVNNDVNIWNADLTPHSRIPRLPARVTEVTFSADAARFAVMTNRFVNVYVTNTDDLLRLAEARIPTWHTGEGEATGAAATDRASTCP